MSSIKLTLGVRTIHWEISDETCIAVFALLLDLARQDVKKGIRVATTHTMPTSRRSQLTYDERAEIYRLRNEDGLSYERIAMKTGVVTSTVRRVLGVKR